MFKSHLRFVALFCLFGYTTHAQEVFKANSFGAGFNFSFGYQSIDAGKYFANDVIGTTGGKDVTFSLGSVNERVVDPNDPSISYKSKAIYTKPSNTLLTGGFQGIGAFNSILIGGELNYAFGSKVTGTQMDSVFKNNVFDNEQSSSTSSQFMGGDVMLDIGFVALRKRGLIVYPMIGIGYSATALWLQQTSNSTRRLFPIASGKYSSDENKENAVFWTANLGLDFGLGIQYMVGASTEDRAKGFSIGVRFGYKMQLPSDNINVNWDFKSKDSYDTQNVSLPKLGSGGIYAKLLIGFGKIGDNR